MTRASTAAQTAPKRDPDSEILAIQQHWYSAIKSVRQNIPHERAMQFARNATGEWLQAMFERRDMDDDRLYAFFKKAIA